MLICSPCKYNSVDTWKWNCNTLRDYYLAGCPRTLASLKQSVACRFSSVRVCGHVNWITFFSKNLKVIPTLRSNNTGKHLRNSNSLTEISYSLVETKFGGVGKCLSMWVFTARVLCSTACEQLNPTVRIHQCWNNFCLYAESVVGYGELRNAANWSFAAPTIEKRGNSLTQAAFARWRGIRVATVYKINVSLIETVRLGFAFLCLSQTVCEVREAMVGVAFSSTRSASIERYDQEDVKEIQLPAAEWSCCFAGVIAFAKIKSCNLVTHFHPSKIYVCVNVLSLSPVYCIPFSMN